MEPHWTDYVNSFSTLAVGLFAAVELYRARTEHRDAIGNANRQLAAQAFLLWRRLERLKLPSRNSEISVQRAEWQSLQRTELAAVEKDFSQLVGLGSGSGKHLAAGVTSAFFNFVGSIQVLDRALSSTKEDLSVGEEIREVGLAYDVLGRAVEHLAGVVSVEYLELDTSRGDERKRLPWWKVRTRLRIWRLDRQISRSRLK